MPDALRRAIRTFAQGFIGVLALIAIPALNALVRDIGSGNTVSIDVDFWSGAAIAAVAGGLIALVSWLQNALEDSGVIPAPLKAPASGGERPVPDPGP